jgi:hypothetical protein
LIDEKDRWYRRFERLLDRTKKLGDELGKSSLSPEDKAELWEFFWSFCSGIHKDLQKQYPALKKEH